VVWWALPPVEAQDVLELIATGGALLPPRADRLTAWLAARIVEVEGVEGEGGAPLAWGDIPIWRRPRVLDLLLTWGEQQQLAHHLLASVSLTREAHGALTAACRVLWDGGCECPVCKGEAGPAHIPCRYTPPQRAALAQLLAHTPQLDQPDLSAPWWLWQMSAIWRHSKTAKQADARKQRQERERVRDRLSQLGLVPQ
jgi:hypothetical protein